MKRIYVVALIGLVVDRIVKFFALSYLSRYVTIKVIPNFFYLTFVRNYGAGFGILQNKTILLVLLSGIVLVILNTYLNKSDNLTKLEKISYGLLMGGIVGNLMDRIIYGYVIDLFDFKLWKYSFPVFNIADIMIVISIFLLILFGVKGDINGIYRKK